MNSLMGVVVPPGMAEAKIGDGISVSQYSDCYSYTLIRRTDRTMWLQRDKTKFLNGHNSDAKDKVQFTPGGFVGHTRGHQRWDIKPNPDGAIVKVTKRSTGYWVQSGDDSKSGRRAFVGRVEHYDYNF